MGLGVISLGLKALLRGKLFYQNGWGGAMFVPLEVVIGGFIIYLATFGWRRLLKTFSENPKGRKHK